MAARTEAGSPAIWSGPKTSSRVQISAHAGFMRRVLLLISCAASPAAAESTHPCEISIVRAPAEVRAAIQEWVAKEDRCVTSLEIRVFAMDGEYYVLARDGSGWIRERTVPDAQSAGAVVSSWAGVPSPMRAMSASPPGCRPDEPDPEESPHWITGSGFIGVGASVRGGHAEVDVLTHAGWALGAAVSVSLAGSVVTVDANIVDDLRDIRGMAYVAYTARRGNFYVRPAIAGGFVVTTGTLLMNPTIGGPPESLNAKNLTGAASVMLGWVVAPDWAIELGPRVVTSQHVFEVSPATVITLVRPDSEWTVAGGLRRRW